MKDTTHKVTMEVEITVDGDNDKCCSMGCSHRQTYEIGPPHCGLFGDAGTDADDRWCDMRRPACLDALPATSDDKD
jgi:hypothetical protein